MSCKEVDTNLDEGILHNSEWIHRWQVGNTAFNRDKPNVFLDSIEETVFKGRELSVFVPLCGKTPDMLWMYNKGHTICGVEIAEQAVQEFFDEYSIEKEVEDVENVGKLYKSKDGRIKLYVADMFDLSKSLCGQFDMIWDSKSLVAINLADHQVYRDLLLSLLKPDGVYYLIVLEYDPKVWPGPPHSLSDQVIKDLFGEHCSIEMVEESERTGANISADRPVTDDTQPKLSSAAEAIRTSSFVFDRIYKIMFK